MYAIVNIQGQQIKVAKKQSVYVNRIAGKEGSKISFNEVLLIDDNGKINVGTPTINGAEITAKIEKQLKADKILVFKKKRRKGYQKLNGHRQSLTQITIDKIVASGAKASKTDSPKKTEPPTQKKSAATASAKTTSKSATTSAKPVDRKTSSAAKTAPKKPTTAKPKAEAKTKAKTSKGSSTQKGKETK